MKKILIMNDLTIGGGVENVLWDVIDCLNENDYDVTLLTPDCAPLPKNKSIKYLYFGNKKIKNKFLYNLFKIIKIIFVYLKVYIGNYDYTVAMKEGRCMKYVRWMRAKKKFAWVHVDYDQLYYTKKKFKFIKELDYMKTFNQVICVSNQVRSSIIHNVGDPGNLKVIYNPINLLKIKELAKAPVYDFLNEKDKVLFILVGRLSYEKGVDRLVYACKNLKSIENKFCVMVLGDGPEKENIQKLIDKYGIKNIILMGHKDNPYKYISLADCYISTSRTESFGLSIYEALVCQKKCVITNCPGACELFDSEENGIIVENSINGICEGICTMINQKGNLENNYISQIETYCNIEEIVNLFK